MQHTDNSEDPVKRVRLVLAGNSSGLRNVVKELVESRQDMEVVGELGGGLSMGELMETVTADSVDVVILDVGRSPRSAGWLSVTNTVRAILQKYPDLVVVVLEALGRRAVVHSAVYVNEVGLTAMFNTIRAVRGHWPSPLVANETE